MGNLFHGFLHITELTGLADVDEKIELVIRAFSKEIDRLEKLINKQSAEINRLKKRIETQTEMDLSDTSTLNKPAYNGEFSLNDSVSITEDIVTNGIFIQKGSTGTIDNRLISSNGIKYVIKMDSTGQEITITDDYFVLKQ